MDQNHVPQFLTNADQMALCQFTMAQAVDQPELVAFCAVLLDLTRRTQMVRLGRPSTTAEHRQIEAQLLALTERAMQRQAQDDFNISALNDDQQNTICHAATDYMLQRIGSRRRVKVLARPIPPLSTEQVVHRMQAKDGALLHYQVAVGRIFVPKLG